MRSIGEIILMERKQSTRCETRSNGHLFIADSTWSGLGLKPSPRSNRPPKYRLNRLDVAELLQPWPTVRLLLAGHLAGSFLPVGASVLGCGKHASRCNNKVCTK